jgi:site-specific recombinase XerD
MPRRKPVPSYRLHKQSGQAIVTLPDGQGGRHDVLLGKYDTPESKAEYRRVLAEWEVNGYRPPARAAEPSASDLTVNEIILPYWQHVEGYYRQADGRPTSEVHNIKLALRPLKKLYGHTRAYDFDSLALEALREQMIRDGHCRNRVNKDVARVKRVFSWAASKRLVPAAVPQLLATVEGLRAGRSAAKETPKVKPVADEVVEATLPHLRPQVAAMVRLQRLTGMRPGEVVVMRGIDLEMTGKVWVYRPGSDRGPHGAHKTAYRGQDRFILIGPRAQEVLRPWLRLNLAEYLFQPKEARLHWEAEKRRARQTPIYPSTAKKQRKQNPKRKPGERYTGSSYANAVAKAVLAARRRRAVELYRQGRLTIRQAVAQAIQEVPHWHPNQLRHAKATEIRREAGLDAARAVLGHRGPAVTEVYAELDMGKAAEVMERLG